MCRHIPICTDGSGLSRRAPMAGIKLARMSSGRISLLYVLPRLDPLICAGGYVPESDWMDSYEGGAPVFARAHAVADRNSPLGSRVLHSRNIRSVHSRQIAVSSLG